MLHNYLAAAIRNLFRDRAYAVINIFGLALGFAAAILIALFVRDELTYDRAHPQSERIFRLSKDIKGLTNTPLSVVDAKLARALELEFPEVELATRLRPLEGTLRQQDVEITGVVARADSSFARMFPPKVVAGDAAALDKPGMLMVTRRLARQLFNREDVLGETVDFNRQQTLRVGAVIENLPSNTHFNFDALVSTTDEELMRAGHIHLYLRLRPGGDAEKLRALLPAFAKRQFSPGWKFMELKLVALHDIHFLPPATGDSKPPSDRRAVNALIVVGLLILFVAGGNFVSMMTARSARRAVEVGVRKAVGATRRQIIVQFLGECLFYAGLALGVAIVAVELVLPGFNGFLQREIAFDYLSDVTLGAAIAVAWLAIALAAGAYPAFVLSQFRPVTVLKGMLSLPGGPGRLRNALVVLQFATLVALIVATITIYRQTRFALEDQLRVPGEQMLLMGVPCTSGFRDIAARIPGVHHAACASGSAFGMDRGGANFVLETGGVLNLNTGTIDTGFFEIFGIAPLAGRLFDDEHGEDHIARDTASNANPSLILNESAARALGYANPGEAVGKTRYWHRRVVRDGVFSMLEAQGSQVVGVVPDFTAGSIRTAIEPTAYFIDPGITLGVVMKLDGKSLPETLRAVEAEWKKATAGRPFRGRFMSQLLNDLYADIQRQTQLFAAFSAVAIIVASLGLLGLAVFTAERRTREIGLRKVMGASRSDILRFIGWEFARPVLLANVIAWPLAWFFMHRWLEGFAYHVDLRVLTFVAASGLALIIALITVSGHALLVARARPAEALRYE